MTTKTLKQMAKEINTVYKEDGVDAQISIVGRSIFLVDFSILTQGPVFKHVENGVTTFFTRGIEPVSIMRITPGAVRRRYHDDVERRVAR